LYKKQKVIIKHITSLRITIIIRAYGRKIGRNMSYQDYEKAQKMGIKAYKNAVQDGKYPYLPVLDEILSVTDIRGEANLGLVQIPLNRVVGTSTAGRTEAFANNFMPLLDFKTEFGGKWSSLCDSHMEEGIREPIKVYEYLNYYYVVEGNKRVSVLKYFDAVSVPANVTRKIPKLTDDPVVKIYYEFMEFYKVSGVNFIWLSKEGRFKELLSIVSPEENENWGEETLQDFVSLYYMFASAYYAKGGKKLQDLTTGDAFLIFLRLYGYAEAKEMSMDDLKSSVTKIWKEFLIDDEEEVSLSMEEPSDFSKKSVLGFLKNIPTNDKTLNVAFVYDKDPERSDWLFAHELGRNHIKEVFGKKLNCLKVINVGQDEECIRAMEELITEHNVEVIFTTSSTLVDSSLKVAIKYPNVKILNCSLNTSHKYIRTYYSRLYEAKFLSGMIAGTLTETDKIGYIADYPIYGITANINAFALGAKFVNPRVKLYLEWTTLEKGHTRKEVYKNLYNDGVDFISDQDLITPKNASRRYGVYKLTDGDPINIAMPVYNWGVFYEKIIHMILNGKWNQADAATEKAINYWWGFASGVIDIIVSNKVPSQTRRLVEVFRRMLTNGEISPFEGEIISQSGEVKCSDGERIKPDDIMKMDWLAENVVGQIPVIKELKEAARPIVESKGVLKEEDENTSPG